jgi:hypothetical protein
MAKNSSGKPHTTWAIEVVPGLVVRMKLLIPLWTRLRFVSNSTAAKATILVPIIGYLILFNQSVVEFLNLIRDLDSPPAAGVSYRLILLYLGLTGVAGGVLVYGWYCPNEVKHYGSAAAFVQGDGPSLRGFVIDEINQLLGKHPPYSEKLQNLSWELSQAGEQRVLKDNDWEKYRIENLHLYLNRSHWLARVTVCLFYGIGFGLLAIPSGEVFGKVLGLLWRKVLG